MTSIKYHCSLLCDDESVYVIFLLLTHSHRLRKLPLEIFGLYPYKGSCFNIPCDLSIARFGGSGSTLDSHFMGFGRPTF